MMVKKPAIAPQIWTIEARDESVMSCNGEEVTRNPVSMVTSPAITDAAKAAVGFGCVLVAKSYLTHMARAPNLSRSCNRGKD